MQSHVCEDEFMSAPRVASAHPSPAIKQWAHSRTCRMAHGNAGVWQNLECYTPHGQAQWPALGANLGFPHINQYYM